MVLAILFQLAAVGQWSTVALPGGGQFRFLTIVPTHKDYPKAARRADAEGRTVTELTIATNGKLVRCRVVASSGNPDLDERSCDLYRRRGKFYVSGRSTPVTAQAPVRWVLQ